MYNDYCILERYYINKQYNEPQTNIPIPHVLCTNNTNNTIQKQTENKSILRQWYPQNSNPQNSENFLMKENKVRSFLFHEEIRLKYFINISTLD